MGVESFRVRPTPTGFHVSESAEEVLIVNCAAMFADGEVHEMTTSEIRDLFGFEHETFRRFRSWLRNYARPRPEIQLSIQRTETGLKFCMGIPPLKWEAPSQGGWRASAKERKAPEPRRRLRQSHKDCIHPATNHERGKCRDRRRTGEAVVTDGRR